MNSAHSEPIPTEPFVAELYELAELARASKGCTEGYGDLARRAERLGERIDTARYHVAVLGDFNLDTPPR